MDGRSIGGLIGILLIVGAAIGWVWNIVKLVQILDLSVTGMLVARAIGVFVAPLGAILGYL
jgi:hypothetical protein